MGQEALVMIRRCLRIVRRMGMMFAILLLVCYAALGAAALELVPSPVLTFLKDLKIKPDASLGDLASALVAFISLVALFLAWYQLRGLTLQTRATVLLSLDERWEGSKELGSARQQLADFDGHVLTLGKQRGLVDLSTLYAEELERMRTTPSDQRNYKKLIRICGFFETVGYAARAKYIRISDVINLLGGTIEAVGQIFEAHILSLQERTKDSEYYGNLIWLIRQRRSEADTA